MMHINIIPERVDKKHSNIKML